VSKQSSTDKKPLLISSHKFRGIESFDWFQKLPNIGDYNHVILDTPRIFTFLSSAGRLEYLGGNKYSLPEMDEITAKIKANLPLVKNKLIEMLEFDVQVYALYCPDIVIGAKVDRSLYSSPDIPRMAYHEYHEEIPRSKWVLHHKDRFNTNDWCPIKIVMVEEEGKDILIKDRSYEEYFRNFKRWQYYFVPESLAFDELEEYYESKWKAIFKSYSIATNKLDKPIALGLVPLFHKWAPGWDGEPNGWEHLSAKNGGSLILLPVDDIYNTRTLIEALLRRTGWFEETPPPDWLSTIEIPREASLRKVLITKRQYLSDIESEIKQLDGELTKLQEYKGLLYETGITLQEIVKSTLEQLGAEIMPSVVTDEFMINIGGKKALIEVKGVKKSITKRHVSQLNTDLDRHRTATGEAIHGILIGTTWRLFPLEQRDTHDKPAFSQDVVNFARDNNIGLVSGTELFKAFCRTLEEPEYKKVVLDRIITGTDVIVF